MTCRFSHASEAQNRRYVSAVNKALGSCKHVYVIMRNGFVRCSYLTPTSTINMFTAMGGRVAGGVMLQKWEDLYCCMEIWSGKE